MKIKEDYFEQQRTLKNSVSVSEVSGIPVEDRAHILQTALDIYPKVEHLVAPLPVIQHQRLAAMCLATTAMIPYAPSSIIVEETVLGLILFAADDLIDGAIINTFTVAQIEAFLTLFSSIAKSGGDSTYRDYPDLIKVFPTIDEDQDWVQVAKVWRECCQQLQKFPLANNYYGLFAKHVELGAQAQRTDLYWWQALKEMGTCPTYEQYIENARKTVVSSINFTSLLVMVGEPVDSEFSLEPSYANLETLLDEVMLTASSSIRLANDIRSFERDRSVRQPNSLLVLMLTQGLSEKEAETMVLKEIDTYLKKMEALISLLPSSLTTWGDAVRRVCWFASAWYQTREFHHFTKEMLTALSYQ